MLTRDWLALAALIGVPLLAAGAAPPAEKAASGVTLTKPALTADPLGTIARAQGTAKLEPGARLMGFRCHFTEVGGGKAEVNGFTGQPSGGPMAGGPPVPVDGSSPALRKGRWRMTLSMAYVPAGEVWMKFVHAHQEFEVK